MGNVSSEVDVPSIAARSAPAGAPAGTSVGKGRSKAPEFPPADDWATTPLSPTHFKARGCGRGCGPIATSSVRPNAAQVLGHLCTERTDSVCGGLAESLVGVRQQQQQQRQQQQQQQ